MNMEQLQELLSQREKQIDNLEYEISILKSKIESLRKINHLLTNDCYNNTASKGYIIRTLQDLNYSRDEIRKIIINLIQVFDELTIQQAKQVWVNW